MEKIKKELMVKDNMISLKMLQEETNILVTNKVQQCRGVQYVHWVMHKCIMVKVGGEKYTQSM